MDRDSKLKEMKKRLRHMYATEKKQRRRTRFTAFINPSWFMEKRYNENKQFEKRILELKKKRKLQEYIIDPLFQTICLRKKRGVSFS
jgi:hypothetical protein